jgi:adenylate cyclase
LPNQPVDSTLQIYGNGVSKASYINWIVDYNQQLGRDSTTQLTTDLSNVDVRLCYRLASFTDKQYLKIFVERSSPDSTNSSLLLPDDSYKLLLYKNQPFAKIVYAL